MEAHIAKPVLYIHIASLRAILSIEGAGKDCGDEVGGGEGAGGVAVQGWYH